MSTDIQEIFPITKVSDSIILSGIGDLTFGFEISLPEVFTLSEEDYESIYNGILSSLSILPIGTVITQQDRYFVENYNDRKEYKNFSLKQNNNKVVGRAQLRHKSFLYISYPDTRINPLTSSQNSAIKLSNFLKNPFSKFPETYEKAIKLRKEIQVAFQSIDRVKFRILSDDDLLENIYYHYSFDQEYKEGKSIPNIEKDDGQLRVGNKYVGVVSLVNHGEFVHYCKYHRGDKDQDKGLKIERGIGLKLGQMYQCGFGLPFEHTLTRSFILKSKEKTDIKFFFEASRENFLSAVGLEDATKRLAELNGFKEGASNRGYRYIDMSCNLIIPSDSLNELKEKTTSANTVLRNVNESQTYIEPYSEALPLWIGSTPGYTRANYRVFTTVLEHGLSYMTFESNRKGYTEGHLFVDRLGTPIIVDTWNNEHVNNRNGLIEGGSGTGKSFTINNIIDQDLEHGMHVMILDVGHTYKDLCNINKGKYFNSSKLDELSFNIFECSKDEIGNYTPDSDKQLFIQAILVAIWKGGKEVTNEEMAIIMDIIMRFYGHINQQRDIPNITSFHSFVTNQLELSQQRKDIFNIEAFTATLEPFVKGRYQNILNGKANTDLTNEKFVVFDIEAISEDQFAFPVIGLIIIEMVMEKTRKMRGLRKRFIIDEGWKVLKGQMSGFVEYLYRTFRKNEGSVYLATQAISDLSQNVGEEMARVLIQNADTIYLMRRGTSKNYPDLQKWLSLTDFEVQMMKDLKKRDDDGYREFFLKQGEKASILRLESHAKTIAVYSSKGEDKVRINNYFKETDNIEFAINQYTEDNVKIMFLYDLCQRGIISESTFKIEKNKIFENS